MRSAVGTRPVKPLLTPLLVALAVCAAPRTGAGADDRVLAPESLAFASPDGAIQVGFGVDGGAAAPEFHATFRGGDLLLPSPLGLALRGAPPLSAGLAIESKAERSVDREEALGFGKASRARDRFNEVEFSLRERAAPGRRLRVTFRVYDDAIAFRYTVPEQPSLPAVEIAEELTELSFAGSPLAHYLPLDFGSAYEYFYSHARLGSIDPGVNLALPLLLECPRGAFVGVTEAALTDYAGLYFRSVPGTGRLRAILAPSPGDPGVKVRGVAPFSSPWRVLLVGGSPGALLESNVVRLLNPPPETGDTSWIHPGKVVFGWWNGYEMPDSPPFVAGVNTPTITRFIDFAAENRIPYVSLDGTNEEAWYGGPVFEYKGQDITRANPRLDLPGILAYARSRGVRIRLWMHWQGLEKYRDTALPLFESWGVSGIMVDFINGDSQERVRFVTSVVRDAARHHLTVNFHGVYKPTGIERTYPNLLSYEGVLGTEYDKWDRKGSTPEHEMDTLLVRMLAGPLDIHQGSLHPVVPEAFVPNNRPSTQGTITRQMAAYVAYDNPLPMLADSIAAYRAQPALLAYIRDVPTAWDETRVLEARADQLLVIARRSGRDWYVAGVNDRTARSIRIPLGFLGDGDWSAQLLADGADADVAPAHYDSRRSVVRRTDTLQATLARAGGFVVRLGPAAGR